MPRISPRTSTSRWLGAGARALVPGGHLLDRHLANFAALQIPLPLWNRPRENERILVVAPHPDDEVLGCGGLLARCAAQGIPARIVFLTMGDGSRGTQFALNLRQPKRANRSLSAIAEERQEEAIAAAVRLGLSENDVRFLGFPDGRLRGVLQSRAEPLRSLTTGKTSADYERAVRVGAPYTRDSLVDVFAEEVRDFRPTLVLTTPPFDTHLDHAAAARLVNLAQARLDFSFDVNYFLIHCGIWPVPNGFHPEKPLMPPAHLLRGRSWSKFALSEAEIEAKRDAVRCYQTQLASTPRYLHAFVRVNELFVPSSP